jgi:hypothetical protein
VVNMNGMLSLIKARNGEPSPGLHSVYVFVGKWGTSFQWHAEDLFLGAVNYVHFGKPKIWYTVPAQ